MSEGWTDQDLIAAGWARAELDWEERTEAFAQALADTDKESARSESGRAVFLAREAFASDDPRLGTSLANRAFLLFAEGDDTAPDLMSEGAEVWGRTNEWIAAMSAPRVARSSLFHMRMEERHRKTYEQRWRIKWLEFAEEARAVLALPPKGPDPTAASQALARWRRERPAMLNDTRKLMAARLLLLPGA